MQLSIGLDGTDVMAVVQAQPSLLVQDSGTDDAQVSSFLSSVHDYQSSRTSLIAHGFTE